jgi:signal peptidase II
MMTPRYLRTAGLIAATVLALDQATKVWARSALKVCAEPRPSVCDHVQLAGSLELVRIRNAGSVYGFAQGLWLWPFVAALALVVILWLPRWSGASFGMAVGAGLMMGGALGNLVDRIASGGVTDFIGWDLGPSAGFSANLADATLVVGTALTTLALYRGLFRVPPAGPRAPSLR